MTFTLGSRLGRLRLALASWSIAGALLGVTLSLHAQEATPSVAALRKEDAPAGAVHVFVSTEEDDLLLTVAQPGMEPGIVRCYHQCSFWGLPGRYTLWATSPEGDVLYETTLHVRKRTAFKVSSGHPGARTVGLIAAIVGPIAMAGGLVQELGQPHCDNYPCPASKGTGLIVGGLLTTVAGLVVFSATGPRVDRTARRLIRRRAH